MERNGPGAETKSTWSSPLSPMRNLPSIAFLVQIDQTCLVELRSASTTNKAEIKADTYVSEKMSSLHYKDACAQEHKAVLFLLHYCCFDIGWMTECCQLYLYKGNQWKDLHEHKMLNKLTIHKCAIHSLNEVCVQRLIFLRRLRSFCIRSLAACTFSP